MPVLAGLEEARDPLGCLATELELQNAVVKRRGVKCFPEARASHVLVHNVAGLIQRHAHLVGVGRRLEANGYK